MTFEWVTMPGIRTFPSGQLHCFEQVPLVLVPRIGSLERIGTSVDVEKDVDHLSELKVAHPWAEVDAVAGVIPDAVLRQVA
jgi:hypothetical protein